MLVGKCLVRQGKFHEALGHFESILKHDPRHVEAACQQAAIWIAESKYADALAQLNTILRNIPIAYKLISCAVVQLRKWEMFSKRWMIARRQVV